MSNVLVAIPNHANWVPQPLSSICSIISRGSAPVYVETSHVKAIGQRCVTRTDFDPTVARPHSEKSMNGVLTPMRGDVLLNSTGTGTIGRSCVFSADGEFIVDGHVTLLRPTDYLIDSRWLNALIRSSWFQTHMERFCYTGSTNQLELSRSQLAVSAVPVPSFPEQSEMGDLLDTLDTQIRQTKAIIDKLQQVKQGLLHDLLTRGIDANGQLRPPREQAPELYKESPLGWIPKEWALSDLANAVELFSGGTPSKSKADWWAGDTRLLTPKDMKKFELDDTTEKISAQAARLGSRLMPEGTVFIVVRGMILAHTFPVVFGMRDMAFNQDIKAVQARSEMSQRFLAYWFIAHSDLLLRKVTESTHGTKKLDTSELVSTPIGIPSRTEQDSIVERLEAISSKSELCTAELHKLKKQKTGLIDDLLTGRVRVTELTQRQLAS